MLVLKFGGTSVQDAPAMEQVLHIVRPHLADTVLVVSSAMAGVTNTLVSIIEGIRQRGEPEVNRLIDELERRHREVLGKTSSGEPEQALSGLLADLRALVKGSFLLNECSPRVVDTVLSMGERLATIVLQAKARAQGLNCELLDARQYIVTDDAFGSATVLGEMTKKRMRERLSLKPGTLYLTQGFIGATETGVTTVLGRGGSDYSAALFGAGLGASRIEIWTDVDGILTTDPRIVPHARSVPEMTYAEAAELAFFGAKVVHPATIQPAVEAGVPVLVKNTKNPGHPGTIIQDRAKGRGLRAIAGRKGVTLITVSSSRMLNAYGFLRQIFEIFDRHKLSVDLVATSEVTVSMTVDDARDLTELSSDLSTLGAVRLERDMAILCLVGQDVWKENHVVAETLGALKDCPVRMISLGSSDINLSMVVSAANLEQAVRDLHGRFFAE